MDDSNLLPIWNALAAVKRRQILELLEEQPRTTGELCEFFDVSRYAVMKHLNVLEEAGLIMVRREGRKRWNILNERPIDLLRGTAVGNGDQEKYPSKIFGLFPVAAQTLSSLEPIGSTSIDQDTLLKATPEAVFIALTKHVDAWWRWRAPDSLGVYLEPTAGGRFYQAFSKAGDGELLDDELLDDELLDDELPEDELLDGELLAWVTYIKRYEEIRLSGPMGLADPAAVSFIRLRMEPNEHGTRLRLHHRLNGRIDEHIVERFRRRWHDLFSYYLRAFVEEGLSYQSLQDREGALTKSPVLSKPTQRNVEIEK